MLKFYIDIPVRCYYFDLDVELSHHLNFYREKIQGTRRVPDIGFNTYKSKFKGKVLFGL